MESGVQQLVPSQTCPLGQVEGQATVCPQLFTAFVLHLPEHAALLFGVQHVSSVLQTSPALGHALVPPEPQNTVCLQLFWTDPHCRVPHDVPMGSGSQPHAPPAEHVSPPSHPPQSTGCAQLFVAEPHRALQKFGSTAHVHVLVDVSHVLFCPQSVLHARGCPQLSVALPQCVLQKFGSGVQSLVPGPPTTPLSPTS